MGPRNKKFNSMNGDIEISYRLEADIVERRVELDDGQVDGSRQDVEADTMSAPRISQLLAISQQQHAENSSSASHASASHMESTKLTITSTTTATAGIRAEQDDPDASDGTTLVQAMHVHVSLADAAVEPAQELNALVEERCPGHGHGNDSMLLPAARQDKDAIRSPEQKNTASPVVAPDSAELRPSKYNRSRRASIVPPGISALFHTRMSGDYSNGDRMSMDDLDASGKGSEDLSGRVQARHVRSSFNSNAPGGGGMVGRMLSKNHNNSLQEPERRYVRGPALSVCVCVCLFLHFCVRTRGKILSARQRAEMTGLCV
jgi:hypothetical protein